MKYFGIHLDGEDLLVAVLNKRQKLLALYNFSPDKKTNFKYKYLFQRKNFIGGLTSANILIKQTSLNIKKKSLALKALLLQSDTLFPFENNSSIIIPVLKQKKESKSHYLLYGTLVSKVKKTLNTFEKRNIFLDTLSSESMALSRFASAYFPSYEFSFVVHVGKIHTICLFLENNFPIFSHTIKMGKNDLFENLDKDNKFDLELIDESKQDSISIKWVKFKKLITQTFLSLKCLKKVYFILSGNLENCINVENFLFSSIHKDILAYGKPSILTEEYNLISKHALSIGYAIDAIKKDQKSLQFIQNDTLTKKIKRKFYKRIACLLSLSLTFFFCTFHIQKKLFSTESSAIEKGFETLKDFDEKKMGRKIDFTSSYTLSDKIETFKQKILQENTRFPHFTKKIKPSAILAKILKLANNIELKNFCYEVLKYPTIEKPQTKTEIKINLTVVGKQENIVQFEQTLLKDDLLNNFEKSHENKKNKFTFYLK